MTQRVSLSQGAAAQIGASVRPVVSKFLSPAASQPTRGR
jgi:hypothetical protein